MYGKTGEDYRSEEERALISCFVERVEVKEKRRFISILPDTHFSHVLNFRGFEVWMQLEKAGISFKKIELFHDRDIMVK